MKKAKRILFITQEINPYLEESAYTTLGRKLPQSAQEKGKEIRTFMPKWGPINERRNQLHEVIRLSGMNLIIADTDHPLIIKVASIQPARMQVYFIDNDDYFMKRKLAYNDNGEEYDDNPERAIFYARGVLETIKKLRWVPDIIHCQGWISSIIPFYIKTAYADEPCFKDVKVYYSPTNENLKSPLGEGFPEAVTFREASFDKLAELGNELNGKDLHRIGIMFADGVTFKDKEQADLIEFAKAKDIPTLVAPEDDAQKHVDFFDEIWGKGKKD